MNNSRYESGSYLQNNPDWHREDASWKAQIVHAMLARHQLEPRSVVEVGCGSGEVLLNLRPRLPKAQLVGYDVSPQAAGFWSRAAGAVEFHLGDFHAQNDTVFDLLLMLDVFEHVRDPFTFLERTRRCAGWFVFHIPLDLSASSVLRGWPLLNVRRKVGHLHYFTKDLALEILAETGYDIVEWCYTGASLRSPQRTLKTRLAAFPRRLAYALNRDLGVRLFGGDTLLVLARAATTPA
jgi:SAM-dependent methyltransferase